MGRVLCDLLAPPLPPTPALICENNPLVRTTVGVVSIIFGTCPTLPFMNNPPLSEHHSVLFSSFSTLLAAQGQGNSNWTALSLDTKSTIQ